jgi:hypothetical protein
VKDENGDQVTDSHNTLNRWKNYCSQLLNVHRVSDVRQIEIHTAEPLVPDPNLFEVEIDVTKFESCKLPGHDQIPAEQIQARSEKLWSEIHKPINSIWNKEELPDHWKESVVPIHKKGYKIDCSNYHVITLLSASYKILSNILLSRLNPQVDEIIGNHQCGFQRSRSNTDQILCICHAGEKWEYNETVHQLFIDFKKIYDLVRKEVL